MRVGVIMVVSRLRFVSVCLCSSESLIVISVMIVSSVKVSVGLR